MSWRFEGRIEAGCAARGLPVARTTAYTDGGAGAEALASAVVDACARPAPAPRYLYGLEASPEAKIESVAGTIYGAEVAERLKAADDVTDILVGWLEAEIKQQPHFDKLRKVIDIDIRGIDMLDDHIKQGIHIVAGCVRVESGKTING